MKAVLAFVNWMVPCMMRANYMAAQANLVGLAATETDTFLGFMLMPTWSSSKGQLWLSETSALKSLACQNLNMDKDAFILLKEKVDDRDGRPLTLKGKLLFSSSAKIRENVWRSAWKLNGFNDRALPCCAGLGISPPAMLMALNLLTRMATAAQQRLTLWVHHWCGKLIGAHNASQAWLPLQVHCVGWGVSRVRVIVCLGRSSKLIKKSRTEEAEQVKTCDMVIVEDIDPDTLPSSSTGIDNSTHRNGVLTGARRFEAIGTDACEKMLDSTLDTLMDSPRIGACVVIDTNPTNGDLFDAFVKKKLSMNIPLFYFGVSPDATFVEFILEHRVAALATECELGILKIPGLNVQSELPASRQTPSPAPPAFEVLVYDPESKNMRIPADAASKWGINSRYSEDYVTTVTQAQHDMGFAVPLLTTDQDAKPPQSSPLKRQNADTGPLGSPEAKKARAMEDIVSLDSITDPMLLNIKPTNMKANTFIRVFLGHKVAIVNQSDAPLILKKGLTLLGFGKVSYDKIEAADSAPNSLDVVFTSSQNEVLLNNTIVTLGRAVTDKRTMNPTANVCYHTMADEPSMGVGEFTLSQRNTIRAKFEPVPVEESANQAQSGKQDSGAAVIPLSAWTNIDIAKPLWAMRWASSGLMPIRPQITLMVDITVEPQKALRLTKW